jgi:hypothetical protein
LAALDQMLQFRQAQESKEHSRMLTAMQHEANETNQTQWDTSLPSLFECKILRVEVSLDGTKMLKNIKVGDVVDVIDEGIGPNKAYHLCRLNASNRRKQSIGWYPIEFLENI